MGVGGYFIFGYMDEVSMREGSYRNRDKKDFWG